MDCKTQKKLDYRPFTVVPKKNKKDESTKSDAPIAESSQYKLSYPNWHNQKALIEKSPQYPIYSLPFKG